MQANEREFDVKAWSREMHQERMRRAQARRKLELASELEFARKLREAEKSERVG